MSHRLIHRAALFVCLAVVCVACSKKQSSSQDSISEKQTQKTGTEGLGSVQVERRDGSQPAVNQLTTPKAESTLSMNDLPKIRSAANDGNTGAQRLLGVMYSSGQGVPRDYSVAALWFQKAAEGGDRLAYVDLGVLYRQGLGVSKDPVAAYMWFSLAADAGDKYSETALAPLTSVMSQQQLSDGQARTDEWKKTHANWKVGS